MIHTRLYSLLMNVFKQWNLSHCLNMDHIQFPRLVIDRDVDSGVWRTFEAANHDQIVFDRYVPSQLHQL